MQAHWFRAGRMNHSITKSRFALASFVCIAVSWLLLFTGAFRLMPLAVAAIVSAPLALMLSIGGLIWDRVKPPAVIAMVVAVVTTLLILSIGV
jgi:hypothetical protein